MRKSVFNFFCLMNLCPLIFGQAQWPLYVGLDAPLPTTWVAPKCHYNLDFKKKSLILVFKKPLIWDYANICCADQNATGPQPTIEQVHHTKNHELHLKFLSTKGYASIVVPHLQRKNMSPRYCTNSIGVAGFELTFVLHDKMWLLTIGRCYGLFRCTLIWIIK
jgi:hypothetical protein